MRICPARNKRLHTRNQHLRNLRGFPVEVSNECSVAFSNIISLLRLLVCTPNFPTNIIPTNIAWLKLYGKFPMDMRIPPLKFKIVLESSPLKSTILVGRLGVSFCICIYTHVCVCVYIYIYITYIYVYIIYIYIYYTHWCVSCCTPGWTPPAELEVQRAAPEAWVFIKGG